MAILLIDVARRCRDIITTAETAGLAIDDGNVIDLCADNLPCVSLSDLRSALIVAGFTDRFPRACSGVRP